MIFSDIQSALFYAVQSATSLPTAWPNKDIDYDSVKGKQWIEVFLLPEQPESQSIGTNGTNYHSGSMTLEIRGQVDNGTQPLTDIADQINQTIKIGANFSYNTATVTIQAVGLQPAISEGAWYRQPLNVDWYSYENRG